MQEVNMDLMNFDATQYEEQSFELIKSGAYKAVITEAEERQTKSGEGSGLNLKFQIVEGKYKDRNIFLWINKKSNFDFAEKQGKRQIKVLKKKLNLKEDFEAHELVNKIIEIAIIVKKDKNGEERNDVKLFSLIPAGKYYAKLVSSANVESQKGVSIELIFEITEGQFKGEEVTQWISWKSSNPISEDIGRNTISSICKATGNMNPKSTEDLHGIDMIITAKVKKDQYGIDQNNVSYCAPKDSVRSQNKMTVETTSQTAAPWQEQKAQTDDVPF